MMATTKQRIAHGAKDIDLNKNRSATRVDSVSGAHWLTDQRLLLESKAKVVNRLERWRVALERHRSQRA